MREHPASKFAKVISQKGLVLYVRIAHVGILWMSTFVWQPGLFYLRIALSAKQSMMVAHRKPFG
jgi:hypothetical protein